MMTTTPTALLLIKAWEGFKAQAYLDSVGIPTIGFGTIKYANGDAVMLGDEITDDEAEQELFHYIRSELEPAMDRHFGEAILQPNQRDALASFLYNLGGNERAWPTLKRLINSAAPADQIADQWMKYHKAGGSAITGLYRRRMAEVLVWLGMGWETANSLVQNVQLGDDWRDLAPNSAVQPEPFESEIFDEVKGDRSDPVVIVDEPISEEPMPAPKAPRRPVEPFRDFDPAEQPKNIAFSKRVHGLFLIFMGWITTMGNALAGMPFVSELAAMSPLSVADWRIGILILMAGFVLHWFGQVKAKGPLK
ncbi:MAG: lysozyme [Pseudomonadota bacterium]